MALSRFRPSAASVTLLAVTLYLGFEQGGFFPAATAAAATVVAVVLIARTVLVRDPFAGFGPWLAWAGVPLGLLVTWTAFSALSSDAPGRALSEFNRSLLYLLILLLFGSMTRELGRARALVRAVALAATALCTAGLLTRMLPDVFAVAPGFEPSRISFPLTYWNALGLLAGIGLILCFSLTSDERESAPLRVLAGAAIPILAVTLLLTFSRGAVGVTIVGLVSYVLLAHNRGLVTGALAVGPLTGLAVVRAYEADLLATRTPSSPGAIAQGHALAETMLVCVLGAVVLRAALLVVDGSLRGIEVDARRRRGVLAATAGVLALVALVAVVIADVPERVGRQYQQFARGNAAPSTSETRDRLTYATGSGRLEYWRVAREAFGEAPLAGRGAGTFEVEWTQRRRTPETPAVDAHSLYLETAAELGVLGLALLATVLVVILARLAWSARGSDRAPWLALLCCVGAWTVHAAVDWDWEMPAVSLWVFAAGGVALAARREGSQARPPGRRARALVATGVTILAVAPVLTWLAQRSLADAQSAFARGDCSTAIRSSVDSVRYVGLYPEPYELIGYCDARLGGDELAMRMMENAARRDPQNWRYSYGVAIVRGVAGADPRAAAERAVRLNPGSERASRLAGTVARSRGPRQWETAARRAPVPPQRR